MENFIIEYECSDCINQYKIKKDINIIKYIIISIKTSIKTPENKLKALSLISNNISEPMILLLSNAQSSYTGKVNILTDKLYKVLTFDEIKDEYYINLNMYKSKIIDSLKKITANKDKLAAYPCIYLYDNIILTRLDKELLKPILPLEFNLENCILLPRDKSFFAIK